MKIYLKQLFPNLNILPNYNNNNLASLNNSINHRSSTNRLTDNGK